MDQNELASLKTWFSGYVGSFSMPNEKDRRNIILKQEHTHNVCANILEIARGLALTEQQTGLAEAVALFHDVGRFPQYQQHKTFRDSISVNHAALGVKVLRENKVLKDLPRREQDMIIRAVTLHNVFTVPSGLDEETLLYAKLIRDADKLDIWRVFMEYFELPEADRPTAAGLGLPDTPGYSPEVLSRLSRGKMVELSTLKTLNDFKLLQLAWMYDLNFVASLRLALQRGAVDKIVKTLPRTIEIRQAVDALMQYAERKMMVS